MSLTLALLALFVATPSQDRVAVMEARLAKAGPDAQGLNDLALAWLRRARETGEARDLDQAAAALSRCAQVSPEDFECGKTGVRLLLARSEPAKALPLAEQLNHRIPDNVAGYGLVAEAALALKRYQQAEHAIQWMFDLRPPDPAGLELAAALRVATGDQLGAAEFLQDAIRKTPADDAEQKAWLNTRLAALQLTLGNQPAAGEFVRQALNLVPGYAPAEALH